MQQQIRLFHRDKDHIALDLIYSWLPLPAVFAIQQFWSMIIFALGLIMIVCGLDAVATMGGKYREM
jgi:TRAP-type C4-dicarboxylate transport system permease small subunit